MSPLFNEHLSCARCLKTQWGDSMKSQAAVLEGDGYYMN